MGYNMSTFFHAGTTSALQSMRVPTPDASVIFKSGEAVLALAVKAPTAFPHLLQLGNLQPPRPQVCNCA